MDRNLGRKGKKKNSTHPWRTTALRCKRQGAKPKIWESPSLENLRKACTVHYYLIDICLALRFRSCPVLSFRFCFFHPPASYPVPRQPHRV